MWMPSDDYVPAACVRDAVAAIRDDGVLAATNDAMRGWIAQFGGTLDALPISSDDRAQLEAGDLVLLHAEDRVWELRRWVHDGAVWLTAADVTDREERQSTLFSALRCRALGALAASLSHDLNNQFNSALALSSELGLLAQTDEDRECLRDLERGTKIGATAVSALARMLVRTPARRGRVSFRSILDDALSIVRKAYQQRGVELEASVAEDLPPVRVVADDVLHALTSVLETFLERGAARVELSSRSERRALGAGRARDLVVAELQVRGLAPEFVEALVQVVNCGPGSLRALARGEGPSQSVMVTAFLQRRFGGELRASAEDGQLAVGFCWPAAG